MEDTSEVYHSDEFDDSDDALPMQDEDKPVYSENHQTEGNLTGATSNQNDMFKNIDQSNDKKVIEDKCGITMNKKYVTILSADVPEFVPRNLKINSCVSDNITAIPLEYVNNLSSEENEETILSSQPVIVTDDSNSLHSCERHMQTDTVEMIEKAVQMNREEMTNVSTQTENLTPRISNCPQPEEDRQIITNLLLGIEENKKLQKEVNMLKEEHKQKIEEVRESAVQIFLQSEKKVRLAETGAQIAAIKLDACKEVLKSRIANLEAQNKYQQNQIEMLRENNVVMNLIMTTQVDQYFSLQKRVLTCTISKCKNMITDLTTAMAYLNEKCVPTVDEGKTNIKKWQEHLQEAENYLNSLNNSYEQILKDIRLGNFKEMSNFPEGYSQFSEPNDILHDNYVTTMKILFKQNMENIKLNQQYQLEYSQWWNSFGKLQHSTPAQVAPIAIATRPTAIAAAPLYYNKALPGGTPNIRITNSTASNRTYAKLDELKKPEITEISTTYMNTQTHNSDCNKSELSTLKGDTSHQINAPTEDEADVEDDQNYNEQICDISNIDDTIRKDQTLSKATEHVTFNSKTSFKPFSIVSKNPVHLGQGDTKEEFDSDQASNFAMINKPDEGPNAVFVFNGNLNIKGKENPFTFIVTKDSLPSSSNIKHEDPPKTKKPLDYSQLPDAVRKAGESFCNLFLHVVDEVPEKTENEIFTAMKRVRKRNGKLSGLTRDAIVAAVRTELGLNPEYGYMPVNQKDCVFCLEPFGSLPLSQLQCQHVFHKKCISQWLITKNDCPVCRVLVL